jgi:hypothetical protein
MSRDYGVLIVTAGIRNHAQRTIAPHEGVFCKPYSLLRDSSPARRLRSRRSP